MSIAGNIQTMELSELLQWLAHGSKTGTLIVDNGEVEKKIFFQNGRIVSSASTDPREYLGHFLVSHGFINEEELSRAVSMQEKSKMLLGKILTTIGAISEEDLHRLLRLKAEESIYDLFSWEDGEFRFLDVALPERALVPMNLDVTSIVLEGVHRIDEWGRLREEIPTAQSIPVAIADVLADPGLTPAARNILEQVNDDRTVEEIQLQTHSSEFFVTRVLYEQVRKGRLKIVRARRTPPATDTSGALVPAATEAPAATDLVARAEILLGDGRYEQALRHLRAARSLEPDAKEVIKALADGEAVAAKAIAEAGLTLDSVPRLTRKIEELTELHLSPQEGFILTRVNGSYDVRSIVKISPMPQIDAMIVCYRLFEAGHIAID